ncbi:MAG: hypothetical protein KDB16_06920 [Acidimicrobiales bacterium]|nr:hypothetical protein [Acidimicrobiales bacterium]
MMRLGVLLCDNLNPEHAAVGGDYDVLFTRLLEHPGVSLRFYNAHRGELPQDRSECDAWLVPGSRHSVYDNVEWIVALRRFVAETIQRQEPLVGVCFGHQMVGLELGAPVRAASQGWSVGTVEYDLHLPPPGEITAEGTYSLIASHKDQVLELPDSMALLASAPTCPIAAMVADDILTVQGHPEFFPELAEAIYRTRFELLGVDRAEAAIASLGARVDSSRVSRWILDFVLKR